MQYEVYIFVEKVGKADIHCPADDDMDDVVRVSFTTDSVENKWTLTIPEDRPDWFVQFHINTAWVAFKRYLYSVPYFINRQRREQTERKYKKIILTALRAKESKK